ncbi:uncharacterized protein MYCFIDRAFT_71912 [Pseudocercospora fijiensis CIRAD86]|uniref:Rab-GAP TBC domain-containing protein n=1 Tax=Pseudocercospora fijiensis (strain CIRAD86) TaxID=383855 RepID=M2ZJW8_PSEFD|nr:uncharacterized protein MYCFIDRAFT_71912 [Pseudocercospora fijiensis CIRAD86]EME79404.1 hypothetical protein MYCFIDRAFT_71912 [Pseudocercospora fijiensis CIRAD86]
MTHLDQLLQKAPDNGDRIAGLDELRRVILLDGVPSNSDGMSELRIYVWLILLNAPPLPTSKYLDLVKQGASPAYAKIRNDTFRTLTTDPLFRRRVTENSLTRVLNAVAWKLHELDEARVKGWMSPPTLALPKSLDGSENIFHSPASPTAHIGYVQGMNVMAAPFLYAARSEAEAFAAFDRYINFECPGYVRGSMDGVHKGLALVDHILSIVDPKLASHLTSKGMKAEIYAFPSVLTLCACTPPLPEVLQLWDFLFAFGPHLNLLCIVSQLVLIRDSLLNSPTPKPDFKPLRARKVIDYTVNFARKIPDHLYEQMLNHAK